MFPVSSNMLSSRGKVETIAHSLSNTSTPVIYAYAIFCIISFVVYHVIAEREPSSTLTLSALSQCLAILFLWVQVLSGKGAWGISAKSLTLDALAICFRLCSTLWVNGYLPNSRDGDFVYQFFDVCSVLMLLFLLRRVQTHHGDTYQASEDNLSIGPFLLVCFILSAFLHADMDANPILDCLWMTGLFTSVVAVLPQLWLITKSGGQTGALTSHYIAAMAFSRFLSGCFAWMAWNHLSCEPLIGNFQHAKFVIMGLHVLHIIILCDFFCSYMRSVAKKGFCSAVNFDVSTEI